MLDGREEGGGGQEGHEGGRTGVYFAAEAQDRFAQAGAYHGAVLCVVVDDFVLTVLNEVAGCFSPWGWERCEGLEFVA